MKGLYVAIFAAILVVPLSASAHGPVERESEADTGVSRIFTADAATGEVIAIDLDDAQSVQRLSTPPYIMVLGLSQDRKHLFAMRGRDTQRDFVTVIDTGFDPDSEEVLPPHVARTFPGSAPTTGGLHHGKSAVINGRDAIFMEGTGELVLFEEKSFDSLSEVSTKRIKLAAPDHYHHVISEGRLYNGYIRGGFVQVIDLETGDEVTRIDGCPRLHGMALDEESGRSFWACGDDILVIGTRGDEANSVIARLPYPTEQRVGTFMQGKGGILWGATEGTLAYLYRIDLKADPYEVEAVEVNAAVQQNVTDDGDWLLVLTRDGVFEIRDGETGDIVRQLPVTQPFAKDFHEHTDKAVLPDIISSDGTAYVSVPQEGKIVLVDIEKGEIQKTIDVDGEPTRLVLVSSK